MAIIDNATEIGGMVANVTRTTGDLWLSLLLGLIILVFIGIGFRMPLEIIAMIILPFIIVGIFLTTGFLSALAVSILLISLYIARHA